MEEGASTHDVLLTHDGVHRVLQDGIDFHFPDGRRPFRAFWTQDADYRSADFTEVALMQPTQVDRFHNATRFGEEWRSAVADPDGHWARLNLAFAQRLLFTARALDRLPADCVQGALDLLKRLPATPFARFSADDKKICEGMDARYFVSQSASKTIQNLVVISSVDTNTVKMALHVLVAEKNPTVSFDAYLLFLTEQLEAALQKRSPADQWLVLKAFLWQAWQRATVIHRWNHVRRKLRIGANTSIDTSVSAIGRHLKRLEASAGETLVESAASELPEYMCKWAFELLRTNQATAGVDFGHFIHRYRQAFGHLSARCVPTSTRSYQQCPGKSPAQCRRFAGARIEDQSAHAGDCSGGCSRLYWDESSYRGVSGARAVSLDPADDGLLRYLSASDDTMAVSHVWSHGQGGRPEDAEGSTGFNSCLHRRYLEIARRLACDSYWMDTPCIPQDHNLRTEAIEGINKVFWRSRLTLVCDRDIMTIDVRERDMATFETILAALLVSDWNVRAWTLLEGYQGADNIHLLCKDDEVVRLADIIEAVHTAGDIVLSNMCLAMEHLFPSFESKGPTKPLDPVHRRFKPSPEQSGRLLSHRHASRAGDEIVIWSLLRGKLFHNPQDFWRDQGRVRTGFLMSDAPRISGIPGLSWAPARPDLPPTTTEISTTQRRLFAFEGANTEVGTFAGKGLWASWLVCELRHADFKRGAWAYLSARIMQLPNISVMGFTVFGEWHTNYVKMAAHYRRMCSLPAATKRKLEAIASEMNSRPQALGLLQAMEEMNFQTELPYSYRGDAEGALLAVVEKNEHGNWVWRKVIVWDADVPLPPFIQQEIMIY